MSVDADRSHDEADAGASTRKEAPAFPIAATIAGVQVVTIPLSHYAELLEGQKRASPAPDTPARSASKARSRIDGDPEIAAFLTECHGVTTVGSAFTRCRERFGDARTPRRSSIARFWQRLEAPGGK